MITPSNTPDIDSLSRTSDWSGVRVVVAGFGISGYAAADNLLFLGAEVTALDDATSEAKAEKAELLETLGATVRLEPGATSVLPAEVDLVVTSPGWKPSSPLLAQAVERAIPVWGEVELAWRLRDPEHPAPWLAVTGTNGKTTTVQMLQSILLAAGLRSDLLTRRPDVRAAQADLAAATADIGVATAELFPKLTLVGSLGQQSQSLSDIGSGGSTRFGIGPSFSWPIFAAGRIRAQIRGADARADAAGAAYEKAVLTALSDSETALNRYAATGTALAEREAALDAAQRSAGLAQKRFASGEDDRLAVLEAQSTATAAGLLAIAARADHLTAYVSLTKALGGGWNDAPTPEN